MVLDIPIYDSINVNAFYKFNKEKKRFYYPSENTININPIEESTKMAFLEDIKFEYNSVRLMEFELDEFENIVWDIFRWCKGKKYTKGIVDKKCTLTIVFSCDLFRDKHGRPITTDGKDNYVRGFVAKFFEDTKDNNAIIRVSYESCKKRIQQIIPVIKSKSEYSDIDVDYLTLERFLIYVIAHEISHLLSPLYLHIAQRGTKYYAIGEILAILFGCSFAKEKMKIELPHGTELNEYWESFNIYLSKKDELTELKQKLEKCESLIKEYLEK